MIRVNNINRLKIVRKNLRNNSTSVENILWNHLKGFNFLGLKFRRQHSIGRYILDFYCTKLKIGLELDGKIHDNRKEYDEIKTEFLSTYGIKIIRIKNENIINNIDLELNKLKKFITPLLTKEGLGVVSEIESKEGLGVVSSISDNWDFSDDIKYSSELKPGINEDVVRYISKSNKEPEWMLELRLKALNIFNKKAIPTWGPDLSKLDLDSIYYFAKPIGAGNNKTWEEVPENIKKTFDRLGIPEAEKKSLAGVGAQYDSEVVYHNLKQELIDLGVIFDDMSQALIKYPELVKKYFSKSISLSDHKFAALHYAVWSGGTFLYVPAGVEINEPLQSYFRMNLKGGGQFEHTIIILEDNSKAHYIEGCSAPKYDTNSLHAGAVEIFVGENAAMRYSSVENWSLDTFNLNTKRAIVEKNGYMEWVGGNMGSNTTMLYPCSILKGDNSKVDHLGLAFANTGQNQDTGAKIIHIGKNTSSNILSKSLSKGGGISTYRGLIDIKSSAIGAVSKIDCDGLLIDSESVSDTIPVIKVANSSSTVAHEASAGKINELDLFYLKSRGISEKHAKTMIVNGFLSPIMKELPLEYASEMNVLISMEFEGGF